jgi:hypothetical protein
MTRSGGRLGIAAVVAFALVATTGSVSSRPADAVTSSLAGAAPIAGSLALDGVTGHAEAPNAPKLNLAGDWTIEAWFKDETPDGYDHELTPIVAKMDTTARREGQYVLAIGDHKLQAGSRHRGDWHTVEYDLVARGVTAGAWHHAAASLNSRTRAVTLYLDGRLVQTGTIDALGLANASPVNIGRSGTGRTYWIGKIDDVRLWNRVRTDAEIAASYQTEFAAPPAGLVANWKFDESSGLTAADSTAAPADAMLAGGALFSADVPPVPGPGPAAKLACAASPTSIPVGVNASGVGATSTITVTEQDSLGVTISGDSSTFVTLAQAGALGGDLGNGPNASATKTLTNGVAAFTLIAPTLSIGIGTDQLSAVSPSSPTLTGCIANVAFTAGAGTQLGVSLPQSAFPAGAALAVTATATLRDANGIATNAAASCRTRARSLLAPPLRQSRSRSPAFPGPAP